jgi:hypothetical protein
MAHVIGIPLLKGNSNVLVTGGLNESVPVADWFAGQAVGFTGLFGGVKPVLVALDDVNSKGFYGFLCEINRCAGTASVVRATESVPLPSDGTVVGNGPALVDPATGLISATGSVAIAGTIQDDGAGSLAAFDGQTGIAVENPVLINLSVSPVFPVAPPLATAKKANKIKEL